MQDGLYYDKIVSLWKTDLKADPKAEVILNTSHSTQNLGQMKM